MGADLLGAVLAPAPVAGKEGLCVRWQMVGDGDPRTRAARSHVGGHPPIILVDRDRGVGSPQPQLLAHETEGHRVEGVRILHVAVAVHGDTTPMAEVRGDGGQRVHQRLLNLKTIEWTLARGAVNTATGFLQHPAADLGVQIGEIAELPQGQEVALDVLDAGLDDAPLLGVPRRAGIDEKTVTLRAFPVTALHQGVVIAGADDGALGVVEDDPGGHGPEPRKGARMAAQPGGRRLIPDELDVLVAREAQRHHEAPGALEHPACGVRQKGTGAEVDLGGLAGAKDNGTVTSGGVARRIDLMSRCTAL